jgi:hypothetical protein
MYLFSQCSSFSLRLPISQERLKLHSELLSLFVSFSKFSWTLEALLTDPGMSQDHTWLLYLTYVPSSQDTEAACVPLPLSSSSILYSAICPNYFSLSKSLVFLRIS